MKFIVIVLIVCLIQVSLSAKPKPPRKPVVLKPAPDKDKNFVDSIKNSTKRKLPKLVRHDINKTKGEMKIEIDVNTTTDKPFVHFKIPRIAIHNETHKNIHVFDKDEELEFIIGDPYNTTMGSANATAVDMSVQINGTTPEHTAFLTVSLMFVEGDGTLELDNDNYTLVDGQSKFNIALTSDYVGTEKLDYQIDILMKGKKDKPDVKPNPGSKRKKFECGDNVTVTWPEKYNNGTHWHEFGIKPHVNTTEKLPYLDTRGNSPIVTIVLPLVNGTSWYDPLVDGVYEAQNATVAPTTPPAETPAPTTAPPTTAPPPTASSTEVDKTSIIGIGVAGGVFVTTGLAFVYLTMANKNAGAQVIDPWD